MENSKVPAEEIKNPELVAAIENMQKNNNPQTVNNMINQVVNAKLILPAMVRQIPQAHTTENSTVMSSATQVQFRLLENGNHDKFFGVFSDTDELFKWKGSDKAQKVVTDFDSVAAMVMDPNANVKGFVINPFGRSVTFPKEMVISIKQQHDYLMREKHTLKSNTEIKLGDPAEYPIDMMAALINHFSTEPEVNAAYLRLVEQDGQLSYFIVVDFTGDMSQTFDAIAEIAKPYIDDKINLSMMPYSMEFAKNAVKGIEPFYQKPEEE